MGLEDNSRANRKVKWKQGTNGKGDMKIGVHMVMGEMKAEVQAFRRRMLKKVQTIKEKNKWQAIRTDVKKIIIGIQKKNEK